MYTILKKEVLNPTVTRMVIDAPFVAKRAKAGQFIILRVNEEGERIPLTIADSDSEKGTVSIIFQIVGKTTMLLNTLEEGDSLHDYEVASQAGGKCLLVTTGHQSKDRLQQAGVPVLDSLKECLEVIYAGN